MSYDALLKKLDEDGNTGADLSPGDPTAGEAAAAIRALQKRVIELEREAHDAEIDRRWLG